MFFIYGTDAPIYHYPIVTSVMVVVNVFVHVLVSSTGYDVTPWILAFGDGLHPVQWVTHNFLHVGYLHLIGNVIFLFPFGLIVEGKIGWLRMLALYMGIATAQGMTQQVIMLPSDPRGIAEELVERFDNPDNPMDEDRKGELTKQWRKDLLQEGFGSLGASAVIFGLLAVCVIWAPVNEFNVYFRWSLLVSAPDGGEREWSVMTVCGIFVAKEFLMFLMMGMPISSEALHLNGFVVGGVFGLTMLYLGFVDCEGFDLISIWSGSKFKAKRIREQERRERQEAIEAVKPTGPPQAVVPKLVQPIAPPAPTIRPATPLPAAPKMGGLPGDQTATDQAIPADTPAQVPVSTGKVVRPLEMDLALPEFDDGTQAVDPLVEAKQQLEGMIARAEYAGAARQLAVVRKQHPDFIVSPASVGRLAEGLIKQQQYKPAIQLLSLGCQSYPVYQPRWRMRIASLELSVHQDAMAAIRQLRTIDKEMLDSSLRTQYVKIADRARRMAEG